jgi:hypothetical protein
MDTNVLHSADMCDCLPFSGALQAVLLVGYTAEQHRDFQAMMNDMEADMVHVNCADTNVLEGQLQHAFESPGFREPPLGTRRAVIMSGMYTSEVCHLQTSSSISTTDSISDCSLDADSLDSVPHGRWNEYETVI